MLDTYAVSYNQVCGRIIGYQFASPDAFYLFDTTARSIESYMWMVCPSHMDLLEHDNTYGAL